MAAPANVGAYDEYVRTIREAIGDVCDPTHTELLVEPGGAVVCTPGYYVGRVIDVKDIVDEHYVVTELSRINIDHEMKKTSYVHEMVTGAQETLPRQIICGYTCMDSDRLFTAHDEPALPGWRCSGHPLCRRFTPCRSRRSSSSSTARRCTPWRPTASRCCCANLGTSNRREANYYLPA